MNMIRVCILGLIGVLLCGCGDDAVIATVDVADSVSEITEPMTGARLVVEVLETEIDLTGVVLVRILMEWGQGVSVELIEPDWEEAGWTLGGERVGEIVFDGVGYSRVVEFELEPFLDGEYVVQAIGIRVDSEGAGRRIARLHPVGVVVNSVLVEADGTELDGAVGLVELVADDDLSAFNWGVWGGLGVAAVAGMVVVLLRGRGADDGLESIDPEAVLVVAASSAELSEDDLGALHRALVVLSGEHSELGLISREIERERFSGGDVDHRRVRAAALRAAEVCGVTI